MHLLTHLSLKRDLLNGMESMLNGSNIYETGSAIGGDLQLDTLNDDEQIYRSLV